MSNLEINERAERIRSRQFAGSVKQMFHDLVLPTLLDENGSVLMEKMEDFLGYAPMFTAWKEGNTVLAKGFVQYGIDENDYIRLYQSTVTRVIQESINPDTESGQLTYIPMGYIGGYRIWTQPMSEDDSYNLGETVPKLTTTVYDSIIQYVNGTIAYRNDVFQYNEKWYVVNVQQITISDYVNPESTEQTVYVEIPSISYKTTDTTLTVFNLVMCRSLKDDNRFEPSSTSPTWEWDIEVPAP